MCKWRSFKTIVHRNRSMLQALGFEGVGFSRQKRLVGQTCSKSGGVTCPGAPALGRAGVGFCQPPRRVSLFFPRRVRSLLEGSGKSTMHRWGGGGEPSIPRGPPCAGEACRGPVCAVCGGRRCLPSGGSSLHDRGTRLCPRRVRGAVRGAAQRAPSDPVRPQAGPSASRVPTEDPLPP